MGMYDIFVGTCPSCSRQFSSQTKLTSCELITLREHSFVPLSDCKLEVKNACECGFHPVVEIKNGRVVKFSAEAPTVREGPWGSEVALNKDRKAATQKINEDFITAAKAVGEGEMFNKRKTQH